MGGITMKSRLSLVLTLALLILFCAPGIRGEINPYYKTHLDLPSLNTSQAPTVYMAGVGYTSFGIKIFGGLSFGTLRISDTEGAEDFDKYKSSLMGLAGGIGFETGGQVGVEVDIMYVQKGVKLKGTNVDAGGGTLVNFDFDVVINQIALPILLRFKFMPGTSPYLLLGGSIAYILSSTADYSYSSEGQSESGSQDLLKADDGSDPEVLNRLDYSIIGGGGLELALGTMRLYFEGRYIYGLANLAHEAQREASDWMKLTTILIMGGIGF